MSTEPDFAGDAYRACLHGDATPQQQQSAASQIILLHGLKGELLEALRPFTEPHAMGDNYVQFSPRLIVAARAAIAKATR